MTENKYDNNHNITKYKYADLNAIVYSKEDMKNNRDLVLDYGQICFNLNRTQKRLPSIKIGDGITPLKNIPYERLNTNIIDVLRHITIIESNDKVIHYIENGNEYYYEFDENGKIIHYKDSENYEVWYEHINGEYTVKEVKEE